MKIFTGHSLSSLPVIIRTPVIISSVLVLPFLILESINRQNYQEGFPFLLFGILWILPLSLVLILRSIIRNLQTGKSDIPYALSLLPRIIILVLIAWLWIGVLLDQMPCFLGVPNCD